MIKLDEETQLRWRQEYEAQSAIGRLVSRRDDLDRIRAEADDIRRWHERNMREREIQHEMAQAADDDRRQNDG